MEELQARVRALLRRAVGIPQTLLKCGPIAVDVTAQSVSVDGANIELTSFEYRLLEELVCHRGEILSKESLADALYPHNEDRDSNVLEVMIGRLRRKLDPEGTLKPIETMRGRGYRFTLECNSKSP
ncbi:MAG TPA: response regulator transcription factor, partial [Nitrosomonas europaea]|nr:response regulator transcription factor [Nitrosomonas europaea]